MNALATEETWSTESAAIAASPFAGRGLSGGDAEAATIRFAGTPSASPFAEAFTTADEQEAADTRWESLADDLADEEFDEALEALTDEAARRYLVARSRMPQDPHSAAYARQDVEAWLAGQAEAIDAAMGRLEQEYAGGAGPLGEAEAVAIGGGGLDSLSEQIFGGLVRKAFSAAKSVAKAGVSALGKLMPFGRIFGLLRSAVTPLLHQVLQRALGRLPQSLQAPARALAAKLGLGEAEAAADRSSGELFDEQLAELLLAPTDARVQELVAELEAEDPAFAGEVDPLTRLDVARARLTEQLANADPARPPTEQLEEFIPAVMAAMPLVRAGMKVVGRDKVVRFLAGHLATIIQPHIGPQAAGALAPRIADAGLRLLSLEAESPATAGAEVLVDTLEETVRAVAQLPPDSLEDPLRLEAVAGEALAEAAARLLPTSALRPDLDTLESTDGEGTWVLMPRRTPACRRYRTFSRPFDVSITRPQARAIILSGEETLEDRLSEAGVERWPATGEVRLYEALPGSRAGHLAAFEDESVVSQALEELTPRTAALLLGRPGLARAWPAAGAAGGAMVPGQRYFRLVVPGRVLRKKRPRVVVRIDATTQPALRLHLRLGERSSGVLAANLGRQALPDALAAITRLIGPQVRRHLAERLQVRLGRALGAPVPPARAQALTAHLIESSLRALSAHLAGSAPAILAAIKDPAPGITLTFAYTFESKPALGTGLPAAPAMTVRPGRHHD